MPSRAGARTDGRFGGAKPGTITGIDAATFTIEREIDGLGAENGMWNNPHNMWADFALDNVYNSNWFGKWINKIDRVSGVILDSIAVGEAPTHIITIPSGPQEGVLTIPLSADNDLVKVADAGGLFQVDADPNGRGQDAPARTLAYVRRRRSGDRSDGGGLPHDGRSGAH